MEKSGVARRGEGAYIAGVERQILTFLHGSDEARLYARLEALDPGLVVLPGKLTDASDGAALLHEPQRFRFRQALRSERRVLLGHRLHSAPPPLLPNATGPDAGWSTIDLPHAELLSLELPEVRHRRLPPARLSTRVVLHEGQARVKKGAAFGAWVARVLRALEAELPRTSLPFLHRGEGALTFAAMGGQLTYLEEPVLPAPWAPGRRQASKERIVNPPFDVTKLR